MIQNILLLTLSLLGLIALTRSTLHAVYLWQFREYRIDRMLDYIRIPEGTRMFLSKTNVAYIIAFLGVALSLVLSLPIEIILITAMIGVGFDSLLTVVKVILKRSVFVPKISSKSLLVTTLTCSTVYIFWFLILSIPLISDSLDVELVLPIIAILPLMPIFWSGIYLGILKFPENHLRYRISLKARRKRNSMSNLKVVAISGSYGKSTTKEFLVHILKNASDKTIENTEKFNNTTLGVFKKFLSIPDYTDVFVAEIGSYKKGDGSEICEFITPTHCVITGLNEQHLPLFGSIVNIIRAETECADYLGDSGVIIKSIDNNLIDQARLPERKTLSVSKRSPANTRLIDYSLEYPHSIITFQLDNQKFTTKTNALSKGNIENALIALTTAIELGLDLKSCLQTLTSLPLPENTMTIYDKNNHLVIDDTHNTNSTGIENALDLILDLDRQSVVVIDDILELGNKTEEIHRSIGRSLARLQPLAVIYSGMNYSQYLQEGLREAEFAGQFINSPRKPSQESIDLIHSLRQSHSTTTTLLEGHYSKNWLEL